MAQWVVTIPADRWATERLFHHDTLSVAGAAGVLPAAGEDVLLLAGEGSSPLLVGLGVVAGQERGRRGAHGVPEVEIAYTRRAFDEPVPAEGVKLDEPIAEVDADVFRSLADRLTGARDKQTWLVSLDLPIEAATPAEAVRQFWSYVVELGPAELPTFVSPSGDELAMQAFVLGEEANLDPEEDDED
ncbi:hypothetical protein Asp14428_53580 [Actinoplanes sp. NBRC 14428]|uniref:Uncharacterized protein n=1 Tax=Pseudosporangium ferrugineum TaxID=439699 RepID=A0A2T0S4X6_9ACTN|nr:hypothetical protein [Pseudosporangium ferrugineum]PRY28478.1 hypothetical protein CLV70_108272 [Pseudosporangium ferrugineum]BCJ53883.1 hypothetical protein Asp14428_53580 [Actinoplanes sp. NBRC 14428]